MSKKDVTTIIADKVIELIENAGNWEKPFRMFVQRSAQSGNLYDGINQLILSLYAADRGHEYTRWVTNKEIEKHNAKIKKGSKAASIIYYIISVKDRNEDKFISKDKFIKKYGEISIRDKTKCGLRYFNVFNVECVTGLPKEMYEEEVLNNDIKRIQEADEFITSLSAEIKTGAGKACYFPTLDKLNIPKIEEFKSNEDYYSVSFHEFVHWTGHKSRLNRTFGFSKIDPNYAKEELVAETGAILLCQKFNISGTLNNSAAYLKSWLDALNNDKNFIIEAFPKSQKAVDFLVSLGETNRELAA